MLSVRNTIVPVPTDPILYEKFCLEVYRRELKRFSVRLNTPQWEAQNGVDIYGRSKEDQSWVGIQCKKKDPQSINNVLTFAQIKEEVSKALSFRPTLHTYIIVTTGVFPQKVATKVRVLTDQHIDEGKFSVEVVTWPELLDKAANHEGLLEQWYDVFLGRAKRPKRKRKIKWLIAVAAAVFCLCLGYAALKPLRLNHAISVIRSATLGSTPPGFSQAVELVRQSKFNLSGEDLEGLWIPCQDLSQLELSRISAEHIHGTQAKFDLSNLTDSDLSRSELNLSTFGKAKLYGARLGNSNMLGADLAESDGRFADFTGATLNGANLSHGIFENADFSKSNLSLAELQGANLEGANLTLANLEGANLTDAQLDNAIGLTQVMLDTACVVPGGPTPRVKAGLKPPYRSCFTDEDTKFNRSMQRKVVAEVGALVVQKGFCQGGMFVPRLPDLPGETGVEIPIDIRN